MGCSTRKGRHPRRAAANRVELALPPRLPGDSSVGNVRSGVVIDPSYRLRSMLRADWNAQECSLPIHRSDGFHSYLFTSSGTRTRFEGVTPYRSDNLQDGRYVSTAERIARPA